MDDILLCIKQFKEKDVQCNKKEIKFFIELLYGQKILPYGPIQWSMRGENELSPEKMGLAFKIAEYTANNQDQSSDMFRSHLSARDKLPDDSGRCRDFGKLKIAEALRNWLPFGDQRGRVRTPLEAWVQDQLLPPSPEGEGYKYHTAHEMAIRNRNTLWALTRTIPLIGKTIYAVHEIGALIHAIQTHTGIMYEIWTHFSERDEKLKDAKLIGAKAFEEHLKPLDSLIALHWQNLTLQSGILCLLITGQLPESGLHNSALQSIYQHFNELNRNPHTRPVTTMYCANIVFCLWMTEYRLLHRGQEPITVSPSGNERRLYIVIYVTQILVWAYTRCGKDLPEPGGPLEQQRGHFEEFLYQLGISVEDIVRKKSRSHQSSINFAQHVIKDEFSDNPDEYRAIALASLEILIGTSLLATGGIFVGLSGGMALLSAAPAFSSGITLPLRGFGRLMTQAYLIDRARIKETAQFKAIELLSVHRANVRQVAAHQADIRQIAGLPPAVPPPPPLQRFPTASSGSGVPGYSLPAVLPRRSDVVPANEPKYKPTHKPHTAKDAIHGGINYPLVGSAIATALKLEDAIIESKKMCQTFRDICEHLRNRSAERDTKKELGEFIATHLLLNLDIIIRTVWQNTNFHSQLLYILVTGELQPGGDPRLVCITLILQELTKKNLAALNARYCANMIYSLWIKDCRNRGIPSVAVSGTGKDRVQFLALNVSHILTWVNNRLTIHVAANDVQREHINMVLYMLGFEVDARVRTLSAQKDSGDVFEQISELFCQEKRDFQSKQADYAELGALAVSILMAPFAVAAGTASILTTAGLAMTIGMSAVASGLLIFLQSTHDTLCIGLDMAKRKIHVTDYITAIDRLNQLRKTGPRQMIPPSLLREAGARERLA